MTPEKPVGQPDDWAFRRAGPNSRFGRLVRNFIAWRSVIELEAQLHVGKATPEQVMHSTEELLAIQGISPRNRRKLQNLHAVAEKKLPK